MNRRNLLRGSAALIATAGAAIPASAAPHPDAALLTLCSEAMRLDREAAAIPGFSVIANEMMEQWVDVAADIAEMPAKTPDGMRAKAEIIWTLMKPMQPRWDAGDDDDMSIHDPLVWSLVSDMLGRTAA